MMHSTAFPVLNTVEDLRAVLDQRGIVLESILADDKEQIALLGVRFLISERCMIGDAIGRLICARKGFVYFIAADSGLVKIGFSADPKRRLRELKSSGLGALRLLAVIGGTRIDETKIHKRFSADRITGEWFSQSAGLMQFVESIQHPGINVAQACSFLDSDALGGAA